MLDRKDHRFGELANRILDFLVLDRVFDRDILEFAGASPEQTQDFRLIEFLLALEPAREVETRGRLDWPVRIALDRLTEEGGNRCVILAVDVLEAVGQPPLLPVIREHAVDRLLEDAPLRGRRVVGKAGQIKGLEGRGGLPLPVGNLEETSGVLGARILGCPDHSILKGVRGGLKLLVELAHGIVVVRVHFLHRRVVIGQGLVQLAPFIAGQRLRSGPFYPGKKIDQVADVNGERDRLPREDSRVDADDPARVGEERPTAATSADEGVALDVYAILLGLDRRPVGRLANATDDPVGRCEIQSLGMSDRRDGVARGGKGSRTQGKRPGRCGYLVEFHDRQVALLVVGRRHLTVDLLPFWKSNTTLALAARATT